MKKSWLRPELRTIGDIKALTQGPGHAIGKCPGPGDDFANDIRTEPVGTPCFTS